jgi:hypothetical protein
MSIKFLCAGCGHKLKAPQALIGKRVRCTRCEQTMVVPALEAAPAPAGEPCIASATNQQAASAPPAPETWPINAVMQGRAQQPDPPAPLRRPLGGPAAAPAPDKGESELENKLRRAYQQLGGSALCLAVLCAVVALILIASREGAPLGVGLLVYCCVWSLGGAAALRRKAWGAWLVAAVAGVNWLGSFITLFQGGVVPAVISLVVNGGVLTQAALVADLSRKRRWSSLSAHPEMRSAAEQGDLAPLLRVLRRGRGNDLRAALAALGNMGPAAAPAVPDIVQVLLRRAPPVDGDKSVCHLCGVKLSLWNRDLTTNFCRGCFVYFSGRQQDQVGVAPSPSEVAAEVLGRIGPAARPAVEALERVARSPEPHLRRAAEEALRRIQDDGRRQTLSLRRSDL